MVVTATYSDDSTLPAAVTSDNFTYDFSTAGTNKSVTIAWMGKTTRLEGITVEVKSYGPESLVLGRGYDVTGHYAYSPEIKSAILDFGRLEEAGWIMKDSNLRESEFETTAGSTTTEYSESMSFKAGIEASVGVAGVAFKSELSSYFSSDKFSKDSYSFAMVTSRITKDAWFVDNRSNPARLREYLSEGFLHDLENLSPEEIIRIYGTHVMLGGIWGARLDYNFTAKKKIEAYERGAGVAFSTKVEADVKAVTAGAGVSTEVNTAFAELYESSSLEKKTRAIGGLPEYAQGIHNKQEYDGWINSIDGNEVWCDYYPESLIPIYDLLENGATRTAIKAAYDAYLDGKKITVTTALKDAVSEHTFEILGDNSSVSYEGKDSEVDSENGKKTTARLTVTLSKSSNNINAHFYYVVEEGGSSSDRTRLYMNKDVIVPINRSNFMITEDPLSWSSKDKVTDRQQHNWWQMSDMGCPFMYDGQWHIKVDGSGGDDRGKIGIKGVLRIRYSYVE